MLINFVPGVFLFPVLCRASFSILQKLVKLFESQLQTTISNSQEDFAFRILTRQSLSQWQLNLPLDLNSVSLSVRLSYDKHLTNLVFSVHTHGKLRTSAFPLRFKAQVRNVVI